MRFATSSATCRCAASRRSSSGGSILPFLSAIIVLAVGVALIFGQEEALDWFVSAAIAMLVTATRNAWYLLLETNQRRPQGEQTE